MALAHAGRVAFRKFCRRPSNTVVHLNLGVIQAQEGRLDQAISHFRLAIANKPDHAKAHLNLALALSQTDHVSEAIAEHRKTLELQPNAPEMLETSA
jgi:Flp pilus assembly protein TadD